MRFLDFSSLFETEPAHLAALSTFQFDPDFFERRLLRASALVKARRILIFMDAGQWFHLIRQDAPARFLNRRYLVVPVRPAKGVFHPKLNLLVRAEGGQVHCGSNNLTRSGCSSNLELLNSFSITPHKDNEDAIRIAQEAYAFFKRVCDDAELETGRIARQWLDEIPRDAPWITTALPPIRKRQVRLVHTYEGSLWDRIVNLLNGQTPRRFFIISPFVDQEAALAHRIRQRWPKCQIEIVVQQKTTNLPIAALKRLNRGVGLSELRNSSRRLHAKLLAWESPSETGCLVGSANFTTAAFDARNVETCLLIANAEEFVSSLFDGQLVKRPLKLDDFEPGTEDEPKVEDVATALRLTCAILTEAGEFRVSYRHRLDKKPSSLRLAIHRPGEQRPRAFVGVPNKENWTGTLNLPETALQDAHGVILASLVAEVGREREESPPVWIIQEDRLTYEAGSEGADSKNARVEESGEGLTELLEEIGARDGVSAVIERLRHLNIRFDDGETERSGGRKFRLRIRDPFHADIAPQWLLDAKGEASNLTEAIYEFVDRHERQRLRRHAKRGNINGMENFLDIFTTLIRLLYVYHVRGFVHRLQLIGRLCTYIDIATTGFENAQDASEGYLCNIHSNLSDAVYLQEVCDELNYLGHIRAVLVIVQRIRYIPGEAASWGLPARRPSECLPDQRSRLRQVIRELDLKEPSKGEIVKALCEYKMFSQAELDLFEKEIVI